MTWPRSWQVSLRYSEVEQEREWQSEWNKSEMVKVFLGHVHVNKAWRSWRDEEGRKQIYCRTFKQLLKREHTCQSDDEPPHATCLTWILCLYTHNLTLSDKTHASNSNCIFSSVKHLSPCWRRVYDACLKRCGEALTKRELIIAPRCLLPHPNPSAAPPPKPCTTKSPDKDTLLRISLLK